MSPAYRQKMKVTCEIMCENVIHFLWSSLFGWHFKGLSTSPVGDELVKEARRATRQHEMPAMQAALISAALSDGKSSICVAGSLFKLEIQPDYDHKVRIQLVKTGVFNGAVSPSGQQFVSYGDYSSLHSATATTTL